MNHISSRYDEYLDRLRTAVGSVDPDALDRAARAIVDCHAMKRCIFVIGNGGSASTATHMACDLSKGTVPTGEPGPIVWSLTDNVALITAISNDVAYDQIFGQQIRARAREGDVVIAVSASGNSPNLVNAVLAAKEKGCLVIGFTGFTGGKLREMCDVVLHAPVDTYGPAEDAHLVFNHFLVEEVRRRLAEKAPDQTIRSCISPVTAH